MVMETISQRTLRNDNAEVMRRVEAGESFTVTRRGIPVADLVPHHDAPQTPQPRYVNTDAIVAAMADLPTWDARAFDREMNDLDAQLDDHIRDPWHQ